MRQALRRNPNRAATAQSRSLPAPTGGWDTESPIANMPAKNALILDNWVPRAASCVLRKGFTQQATGTADPVESMIAWRGSSSGDKLFACSGALIQDVTTAGPIGSTAYSSAANARWHSTNFANDAGSFAIAVNGANTPQSYNGTAFANLLITGSSGPITLVPATLTGVMVHKKRLWFIEKNTLRVWFLETNAIQGPAQLLDLGPLFYKGGRVVAQATWSLDGGAGMDDTAVFITNEGQVAIYQGLDPTDADQWSLVGVFDLARPLGERCTMKYGADLAILTEDGVLPLSQALNKDRAQDNQVALTAKIRTAFSQSAADFSATYGWQGIFYPAGDGSLAIFNVPTSATTFVQYVQSVQTGSWCRFTGIDAYCWELANGVLYFGGEEGVFQFDTGASDNGEVIQGDMKPAFSGYGSHAQQKRFTMLRALLKCPAIIRPALEMLTDYREAIPTAVPTVVSAGDISVDDADAIRQDWTSSTGLGYVGAPRMRVAIIGDDDTARLSIDGSSLLLLAAGTEHLLISPSLPLNVNVECIGFDVVFQPGGVL